VNIKQMSGFKLDCHKSFITTCVFMPDIMLGVCERGRTYQLIVGSMDSTISFWEIDVEETDKLTLSKTTVHSDFTVYPKQQHLQPKVSLIS